MSVTLTEFVRDLATYGLLAPAELRTLESQTAANPAGNAEALAKELVQQGKLTRYQAAAAYQGKAATLLIGNYLILDRIGAGGMGQVFRARHRKMDRIVALKVLPKKSVSSPDAVERFQREVKAAAKLTHPNIVTAHDADEAGDTHFLVMEYVEGSDLSALVKSAGPLPVAQAVSCVLQAARGLQHAHAAGVIHRDIKPSNLLLDKTGKIKILDMGLARITESNPAAGDTASGELTQTGSMMGTVDYMAPEQALNTHQADARADIYSLGCTLYYLLTGRAIYSGETAMKRLVAHRESPIPSLIAARPEVSADLDRIYHRMVAKVLAERYQSMNEVLVALEPLARGAAPAPTAAAPPAVRAPRVPLVLGVAGAAAAAVVLAVFFAMSLKPADQSPMLITATSADAAMAAPAAPARPVAPAQPGVPAEPPNQLAELTPSTKTPADAQLASSPPVSGSPAAVPKSARLKPAERPPAAVANPAEPATPATPAPPRAPTALAMQSAAPPTTEAEADAPADDRQPVPGAPAQKTALDIIKQIFEADYAAAKNAEGKTALMQKLLAQADKTTDDPTARFVLLAETRDLAAELADTATIDKAVGALAADYRVDALAMQADIYKKLATRPRAAAANRALAEHVLTLAERALNDRALTAQQFDAAEQLLKTAAVAAGKARDAAVVKQARLKNDELTALRHQLEAVEKAEAALAANADDPEANLTLGKFLCFEQDDWNSGLPYLAKGSDATLKELATKSLAGAADAAARVALGDAWWEAADAHKGKDATQLRSGARFWYAAALPDLTGINKTKVEKRLEESQPTAAGPKLVRAAPKAPTQTVDLLKLINLNRDAIAGDWRMDGTSLVVPEGHAIRLQLPFIPPIDYALTMHVTRTTKSGPLVLGLVLDGHQFCLLIDRPSSGISTIDGKFVGENETTSEVVHLQAGKQATVRCVLSGSHVVAELDGHKFVDWQGDAQRLAIDFGYKVPNTNALFIGANGGGFLVSKLEIGSAGGAPSAAPAGSVAKAPVAASAASVKPPAKGALKAAIAPFNADEAKELQQRWAQSRRLPVELTNSVGMKLVFIPPGEFMLGSSADQIAALAPRYRDTSPLDAEQPQHKVKISKPFYLGMYEVTQHEYTTVTGKNPSFYSPAGKGKEQMAGIDTGRYPVESVAWSDAVAFCEALSSLAPERAARRVYRLPTEAEWEFACRAGTATLWSFGDDEKDIARFAWCNQPKTGTTHVVGGKLPNAFGLFDMHGNVNEACLDWFAKDGYTLPIVVDPKGPPAGEGRVTRGGACLNSPVATRSAVRLFSNPTFHYPERGFRVLCGVR